jgi:hypothetical protein
LGGIYEIGARGERLLAEYLTARGRVVAPSDRKTFDLIVDGRYAEVKTSDGPYAKLGFIGLTAAQYRALRDGTAFSVFVVCNAKNPEQLEVLEFDAIELLKEEPKVECTYYWYRKHLDKCRSVAEEVSVSENIAPAAGAPVESSLGSQTSGESFVIHVRRFAATEDAALYIRVDNADLTRLRLVDRQPVRLQLHDGQTVSGIVRISGSAPWLAPAPGSSNASITRILVAAGLRHGSDVSVVVVHS